MHAPGAARHGPALAGRAAPRPGRHYAEIARETGASTATITRIAQWSTTALAAIGRPWLAARAWPRERAGTPMSADSTAAMGAALSTVRDPHAFVWPSPTRAGCWSPRRLLRDAGLEFEVGTRRWCAREDFPLDVLFVRTEDIAEFVGDGVADLGITGSNLLPRRRGLPGPPGTRVRALPARGGRAQRQPAPGPWMTLPACAWRPAIRRRPGAFFAGRAIPVEVVAISGAVEVAPSMGLADGIVDLVSSGSTLVMNGLRSVGELLASQAIVVDQRPPSTPAARRDRRQLATMLESVVAGRRRKYLMMNAPKDALDRNRGAPARPGVAERHPAGTRGHGRGPRGGRQPRGLGPAAAAPRCRCVGILVVPVEKLVP